MRRSIVMALVAVLLTAGAANVLAASVDNITLSALVAQASYSDVDENGNGESVFVGATSSDGTISISIEATKGSIELCEGGDTPDDPEDDFYGFVGKDTSGQGDGKVSFGRQFTSATVSGTISVDVTSFDECTGEFGTTTTKKITVSMALAGMGPIIRETSRTTISIPKQLRAQQLIRGVSRQAAGTLKYGSRTLDVDGVIGRLTLKGHAIVH